MTPSDRCWHCGDALDASTTHVARVEGMERAVCCVGCRAAAEWIDQLGLAAYYRLRTQSAIRAQPIEPRAAPSPWTNPEIAAQVTRDLDESRSEAIMLVEGIRCSACVWLIERIFAGVAGVERIQANAPARRVRVVWDRTLCSLTDILDVFARAGYRAFPLNAGALDDARRRESRDALKRLIVAGFGTMQAMMYAISLYLGVWGEAQDSTRTMLRWLGLLVATPVVFYSARPFFTGAARSLKAGIAGMDVPVATAIALIYAASVIETVSGSGDVYYDSVSMFVFVLLIGRYLEMRARHHAGDLCDALARLSPQFADRIRSDGSHELVAATALLAGDSVHVGEGSIVPADGRLLDGRCRVDEAMLSGESAGVVKRVGDRLIAGSLLVEGSARMTVETVGPNTMLAGIVTLAGRALTERPRLALAGERAAARFVVRIIALAVITDVGWMIVDPARAFTATLSVLVVSCPCAFALAVPAAMTRALAALARKGVLVVRPDALEKLAAATHVVFDKTGTLTQPGPALTRVDCLRGEDPEGVLAVAAALARGNRHPLSQEIVRAAVAAPILRAESACSRSGAGIQGVVNSRAWRLGRADYALGTERFDSALADAVVLACENRAVAAFHFTERIRPDAATALASLIAEGLDVEIVSGDAPSKVSDIAARLGISRWTARTDPAGKLARLEQLRREGARVVMVGDGINDAPILAGADVGVSFAGATDLAQASSDIILTGSTLLPLCRARAIALHALEILRQNQRWALVYNACVIPLGALGFIPPWLAAVGMSVSSLAVVLNALRIGRERDAPPSFSDAAALAQA